MICIRARHIRVLNLFDLREQNSQAAGDNLRSHCSSAAPAYSVLATLRSDELRQRLNPTNTSVLIGWGKNPAIEALAINCLQKLCHQNIRPVGKRIADTSFFSYPRASVVSLIK